MLPPGRARLAIRPISTGAPTSVKTMGMTDVACFAAAAVALPYVKTMSTLSRTSSAASSAKRSTRPSPHRYSIATSRPSIQPSARIRCPNAARNWLSDDDVPEPRYPIAGTLGLCCARATSGNPAAAAPPNNVMTSRRRIIRSPRRRARAAWGNLEFEGFCGLEVDDQLELCRPVDRQIRRLRALQDATGIDSGAAIGVSGIVPIANHGASHREVAGAGDHYDIVSRRQHRELLGASSQERIGCNDNGVGLVLHQRLERRIDLARGAGLVQLHVQPGHTRGCLS